MGVQDQLDRILDIKQALWFADKATSYNRRLTKVREFCARWRHPLRRAPRRTAEEVEALSDNIRADIERLAEEIRSAEDNE